MPRIGMVPRRIVKSCGASSPPRTKWRSAAAGRPCAHSHWPRPNSARACWSAVAGSGWWRFTSSALSAGVSPLTHPRRAARGRADSSPVMCLKVSVPNATSLGRTMRPRSSIQKIVGTLTTL